MAITRINEFKAVAGKAEQLHAFLKDLIPYISSSAGCQSCEVLVSSEDDHSFVVLEKWQSVDDHQQSVENFPKEQMSAVMPLLGAVPKGVYYQG